MIYFSSCLREEIRRLLNLPYCSVFELNSCFFCPVYSHLHVRVVKGIWVRAARICVSAWFTPRRWKEAHHVLKHPPKCHRWMLSSRQVLKTIQKPDVLLSVLCGNRRRSSGRMQPSMSAWEKIKGGRYWSAASGWRSYKKATLFKGLACFCFLWRLPPWSL